MPRYFAPPINASHIVAFTLLLTPMTGLAAENAHLMIRSSLQPSTAIPPGEASALGITQEPDRMVLTVRVVKQRDGQEDTMEAQIYAGARCREAGLLTLPLRRASGNVQVCDFRMKANEECHFIINASAPGRVLRDDFNYAHGKVSSARQGPLSQTGDKGPITP